ncbi:BatD family protein [Vibrio europaeus]|uniref:Aerotolerance protein BatD n=1 Tax=Vibrio europaeus TaxID=300876 RepID=A0A178J6I5_9VIBR|nr:BatD family protein [Vibrio europaeus]MDC5706095.1 BatD family protein [Vibrio europaeus]MDC5709505.1 BatD family protein [Vibrio europaeus]MDC5713904.1 BatD family protein [Vibrio europaeus]MDC5723487.1 BatD family protein [Vibrio europaeus]MDC5730624.1 BatD family protein [Vibrio europaeus]
MNKQNRLTVALFALLITFVSPLALATNVLATVSKNKVVKNEVFQLRIVVDKKVSSDALDFRSLEQDFYLGRPSFGSSVNIINGDRSTRSEWNITLAPQRLGVATIPAFTLDGASSTPIEIQVSVDSNEPKISELIEVQSQLSKSQLYPNESAILTTRLIVKADPRRLQNPNVIPPKAQGISLVALGEPKQYQSVLDGVEVTVLDQSYRVTADAAGEFTLTGIGFKGSVVYGDDRTGTTKLVSANTPAKQFTIKVKPIPTDYKGKWLPAASLSLSQQWQDSNGEQIDASTAHSTRVGESITREINLDIQGLASERFPEIKVNYPSSVRVYQEKPKFSELANGVTRITIKQVIIAEQQGEVKLNDIKLNWWNSSDSSAQESVLSGLSLDVSPASALNNEPISSPVTNQPTTKTVTLYDAGYWPYLTALFAALWLATLLLLFRNRQKSPQINAQVQKTSTTADKLVNALKEDDKVKASFLVKTWLDEHPYISSDLKQKIDKQVAEMNQSQYSNSSQSWQANELIALIKQAEKQSGSSRHKDQLPPL